MRFLTNGSGVWVGFYYFGILNWHFDVVLQLVWVYFHCLPSLIMPFFSCFLVPRDGVLGLCAIIHIFVEVYENSIHILLDWIMYWISFLLSLSQILISRSDCYFSFLLSLELSMHGWLFNINSFEICFACRVFFEVSDILFICLGNFYIICNLKWKLAYLLMTIKPMIWIILLHSSYCAIFSESILIFDLEKFFFDCEQLCSYVWFAWNPEQKLIW